MRVPHAFGREERDGEARTSHDADVFTIRGGKTVRVQVHSDTALMERVYGKKQVASA